LLKPAANCQPIKRQGGRDSSNGLADVLHDNAGQAIFDHFGDRAASEGDHRLETAVQKSATIAAG
jgi:hypothetical protein